MLIAVRSSLAAWVDDPPRK